MRINEHNPSNHNISSSDHFINLKNRKTKLSNKELETTILNKIKKGVSEIDLSSNILSNQTLGHIIEKSVKSRTLKKIGIRFHNLNVKGRHNLKHLLKDKSNWEALNFYIKSLSKSSLSTLSDGLHHCRSLKNFKIVIEYEKDNSTLDLINGLSKINLDSLSLTFNFSIKKCYLSAIAELLQTSKIKSFSLKSKGWEDEKVDLLIKGIRSAKNLKSIDLSDNNFSSLSKSKASLTASVRHLSGSKFCKSQFSHQDMLIQQLVSNCNRLNISTHAKIRLKERGIKMDSIRSALFSGKVLRCNNGFEKGVAKAHDKTSGVLAIISLEKSLIITAYQVYKKEKKPKHRLTTAQKSTPFSIGSRSSTKFNQQKPEKITLIKSESDCTEKLSNIIT